MAKNLIKLLDLHDLRKKIITYVKDEGANLNVITTIVKFMMNCEVLAGMFPNHLFWSCIF